jgi:hypothetical protein
MRNLAQKIEKVNKASIGKFKGTFDTMVLRYTKRIDEEKDINVMEVIFLPKNKDLFINLESKNSYLKGSCKDENKIKENQNFAGKRAKTKIKRLIMENGLAYHWTTEFADKIEYKTNRKKVLEVNKEFLKRLAKSQRVSIPYVAVPEIHPKRYKDTGLKIYHYHIAIGQRIEYREFWSAWNNKKCMTCKLFSYDKNLKWHEKCGSCKYFIGRVHYKYKDSLNIEKIANYFGKYFSKGFSEKDLNQRKIMEKRYFNSKGLKMPIKEYRNTTEKQKEYIKKFAKGEGFTKNFKDGGVYNILSDTVGNIVLNNEI